MINSLKAITAGSVFIIIATLFLELIYVFIAVGYNALAKDISFLNDISGLFRYIVGIPVFTATMFAGGYLTATLVNKNVLIHCIAVALISVGSMILPTLENASLTTTGIVVILLALGGTSAGGLYMKKQLSEEILEHSTTTD